MDARSRSGCRPRSGLSVVFILCPLCSDRETFSTRWLGWTGVGRFESFDSNEERLLRRYHELAQELGLRSFFAEPQRLSVNDLAAVMWEFNLVVGGIVGDCGEIAT